MRIAPFAPFAFASLAACTSPSGIDTAFAAPPGERVPVVVELFSSEGCSSCPPADDVLRAFHANQPIPGAEVLALEWHVDYWNYLGWEDPFSSAASTERQRAYATALGQRGVYTPQMVIDGRAELVGSRRDAAITAIAAAAKAPKVKVAIARRGESIDVSVAKLLDASEPHTVWLAITERGLTTAVARGENAGATLAHAPIVRRMVKIGAIAGSLEAFSGSAALSLDPSWRRENLAATALVQRDRTRQIAGAATLALK